MLIMLISHLSGVLLNMKIDEAYDVEVSEVWLPWDKTAWPLKECGVFIRTNDSLTTPKRSKKHCYLTFIFHYILKNFKVIYQHHDSKYLNSPSLSDLYFLFLFDTWM